MAVGSLSVPVVRLSFWGLGMRLRVGFDEVMADSFLGVIDMAGSVASGGRM